MYKRQGSGAASTATASVTPSAPQSNIPVTPPVVVPPVSVPVIKDLVLPPLTPGAASSGQLTGVGLDQLQGITVGGKAATITPNSSTSASVSLPALAPGVYDLTYTMANGQTTVIAGGLTVPATSTLPVGVATVTQNVAASTVSVSLPVDTSSILHVLLFFRFLIRTASWFRLSLRLLVLMPPPLTLLFLRILPVTRWLLSLRTSSVFRLMRLSLRLWCRFRLLRFVRLMAMR